MKSFVKLLAVAVVLAVVGFAPPPSAQAASSSARISGGDRYETAVAISKETFKGKVPVVVLATGANFPDALAAGPLASKLGGPLLLSARDDLPKSVEAEIKRLAPQKIILVGGTGALSTRIEAAAANLAPVVDRFAGDDRFRTAQRVLLCGWSKKYAHDKTCYVPGGRSNEYEGSQNTLTADTAYVATGMNFADALAAGAAASRIDAPLILTLPNEIPYSVGAGTTYWSYLIKPSKISTVRIVGGLAAVGPKVEETLRKYTTSVTRFAGADRFGTAVAVNGASFASSTTAFVATGLNFPDALAASAAAGRFEAPLYLSKKECVPAQVQADIQRVKATRIYVVGGPGALSDAVVKQATCR